MEKAPTGADLAETACRQFPDTPTRTLARKLYNENKERFASLETARAAVKRMRGATGKKASPKQARVPRPKGKAGWKPECPPSSAEPWLPVVLPTPCRVLNLADLHLPYHDRKAIETAVDHASSTYNPNHVILDGDAMDFYGISRWQQNPKKRDFAHELKVGEEFLAYLKSKFPRAKRIYKLGNHCQRWDVYVWNHSPELANCEHMQLHNVLRFEKYGFQRVDDEPIMAGELPILHGHEFGKSGIAAPVNPARGAFLRTLHSCLVGHLHRTSTHCEPDMFKRETTTWSQGCLCDMTPEYARINKWNQGWAVIDVDKDGQFDVHNFRLSKNYKVRTA